MILFQASRQLSLLLHCYQHVCTRHLTPVIKFTPSFLSPYQNPYFLRCLREKSCWFAKTIQWNPCTLPVGKTGSTSKGEKTPGRNGPAAREAGERARRVQARLREGPGSTGKERVRGSWREVFGQYSCFSTNCNASFSSKYMLFSLLTSQTACDWKSAVNVVTDISQASLWLCFPCFGSRWERNISEHAGKQHYIAGVWYRARIWFFGCHSFNNDTSIKVDSREHSR